MDKATAEREAIRLWRNLPVQDRLTRQQAVAFAAMIAPTLEFDEPARRTRLIEGWLIKDLLQTEAAAAITRREATEALAVPGWPQREGASAIAFVLAILIMIARRPDIITNAMLWAEDGPIYFAQAYNEGWWTTLLRPVAGTLQLFPRLIFEAATLLPLRLVPLFGVWAALVVRAALPAFMFSSRFSFMDWRAKVAISAYYLLMPNLADVHANVTNTHWYVFLYLLLVLFADAPRNLAWRVHDWIVLILGGLTGPMIVFALPVLGFRLAAQRGGLSARWAFAGGAAALALLQGVMLVLSGHGSPGGGTLMALAQDLGARVFVGFLSPLRWVPALSNPMVAVPVTAVGLAITAATLWRGGWRARSLAVLPILIPAAAIWTPILAPEAVSWAARANFDEPGYFVVAALAWTGTLVSFAAIFLPRFSNATLAVLALLGGFLILFDFALPQVAGASFGPQADRFAQAQTGETVAIPTSPPGWSMELIKR
ncbi:MAG TPA: hypothetical protein VHA07_03065 [Devosia sp.]|nr:hypothetical protein [Devosia sp.]